MGKSGEAIEEGSITNRPCPVCRTLDRAREEFEEAERRAESRYNEALAVAKEKFDDAVTRAREKMDEEDEGSTLVITYVSLIILSGFEDDADVVITEV